MRRTRRTYTREFKVEAVRLFTHGDHRLSQVARDLDVDRKLLRRWADQLEQEKEPQQAFLGKGHQKPQDEEVRRLKRENERLREEREIGVGVMRVMIGSLKDAPSLPYLASQNFQFSSPPLPRRHLRWSPLEVGAMWFLKTLLKFSQPPFSFL